MSLFVYVAVCPLFVGCSLRAGCPFAVFLVVSWSLVVFVVRFVMFVVCSLCMARRPLCVVCCLLLVVCWLFACLRADRGSLCDVVCVLCLVCLWLCDCAFRIVC